MLEIQNLQYSYSEKVVIQDFDLKLPSGKVFTILGENGSGKSTLLKLIAGLLDAEKGIISFEDERIKGPSEKLIAGRRDIRLIHQDYKLALNTSVYENIHSLHLPVPEEEKEEKTEGLLKDFNLTHLAEKKVEALSGGEKQRLAIARAMATEPELILMDEPFSNLDLHNRREITQLLFAVIRRENLTALFVTHDHTDALKYSDEVVILKDGKIIQKDTPANIYNQPKNEYCAGLTGLINKILMGKNITLLRPEQFVLSDKGELQGEVLESLYAGPFYEIRVKPQNSSESISLFATNHVELGSFVRFTIKK